MPLKDWTRPSTPAPILQAAVGARPSARAKTPSLEGTLTGKRSETDQARPGPLTGNQFPPGQTEIVNPHAPSISYCEIEIEATSRQLKSFYLGCLHRRMLDPDTTIRSVGARYYIPEIGGLQYLIFTVAGTR